MNSPLRIVIADDHALFRQGLKSLLMLQPNVEVVGEVHRADDLPVLLGTTPVDVLLLDLQMDRWMMDDVAELSRRVAVVILTASENAENGVRALRLGARAIVQKRFAIETLMTAIRNVAEGLVWLPPAVQVLLAEKQSASPRRLTDREIEIVRCIACGLRNAEIGTRLSITESTVKTHLNNIFQKLRLRDRLELMRYAIETGLADPPAPKC